MWSPACSTSSRPRRPASSLNSGLRTASGWKVGDLAELLWRSPRPDSASRRRCAAVWRIGYDLRAAPPIGYHLTRKSTGPPAQAAGPCAIAGRRGHGHQTSAGERASRPRPGRCPSAAHALGRGARSRLRAQRASAPAVRPRPLYIPQRLVGLRFRSHGSSSYRTAARCVRWAHPRALLARVPAVGGGAPASARRASVVRAPRARSRPGRGRALPAAFRGRGFRLRLLRERPGRGHSRGRVSAVFLRHHRGAAGREGSRRGEYGSAFPGRGSSD